MSDPAPPEGAHIDLDKSVKGLSGYLLGGVPVRFGDGSRSGDWLAGLVAHWRIDNRTRLRLENYHVSDDTGDETIDHDLIGLSAWHRLQKTIQLFGRFSLLDGDANELQLRGKWDSEDGLWRVVVDAYFLFERLFEVNGGKKNCHFNVKMVAFSKNGDVGCASLEPEDSEAPYAAVMTEQGFRLVKGKALK